MDVNKAWKDCFIKWPADTERRGVLVTSFNEQIPFDGFMLGEQLLMIDRKTPDTVGTRRVVIPYQNIVALKITEVFKNKTMQSMGFDEGKAPPRKPVGEPA